VICADKNGLCLQGTDLKGDCYFAYFVAKGSAPPAASGLLTSLVTRAKELSPEKEEPTYVSLETESWYFILFY